MEPDELYTLRAQYWLGHYSMALDEGRQAARYVRKIDILPRASLRLTRAPHALLPQPADGGPPQGGA